VEVKAGGRICRWLAVESRMGAAGGRRGWGGRAGRWRRSEMGGGTRWETGREEERPEG
jgi:hypothetical protein